MDKGLAARGVSRAPAAVIWAWPADRSEKLTRARLASVMVAFAGSRLTIEGHDAALSERNVGIGGRGVVVEEDVPRVPRASFRDDLGVGGRRVVVELNCSIGARAQRDFGRAAVESSKKMRYPPAVAEFNGSFSIKIWALAAVDWLWNSMRPWSL